MERYSPIIIMVIVLLMGYFVFRPLVRRFFLGKGGGSTEAGGDRLQMLRETSLEAAALTSLMLIFPYKIMGTGSISILVALTLGLLLLPKLVAPILAFFVVVVSLTRLESSIAMKLIPVLAAFVVLRFLLGGLFGLGRK